MPAPPFQIGSYTIERELGRGGMGVVYLAKDPRLDRHVAIKVLPDIVAADPERLARFEREAKLLATLNHPNIGGIHGLEEADGQRFLVLEYLQGETLAERLKKGTLRSSDAIHVCAQIAAALEAAHENGVIHRDLKPGNIMLNEHDEVKVLDFGLAKGGEAMAESSSDLSASPTLTVGATAVGVVLGTAAYMSPEQARGKPLDRRTDIWSFGCVLYECLTGKQLFGGETVSDTIAKILERQPDWETLPPETPDRVKELIRRCLEKKAKERLRDVGDARIELEEVSSGKTSSISGVSQAAIAVEYKKKLRAAWMALTVTAVAAIAVIGALVKTRPQAPAPDPLRFKVSPPPGMNFAGTTEDVVISPDGKRIVFWAADSVGTAMLWVRELESLEIRPIEGTRDGLKPFWSPDSRSIGFSSGGKLRVMALDGGQPKVLCDLQSSRGGSWGSEWILFADASSQIFRVPIAGGTPEAITVIDTTAGDDAHRFPQFLPDGRHFLYAALPERKGVLRTFIGDARTGESAPLGELAGRPEYAEPGYLIYRSGTQLMAHAFDASARKLSGDPVAIGPAAEKSSTIGAPAVSASTNGWLVHPTASRQTTVLTIHDMRNRMLETLDLEPGAYWAPHFSPDGRYVAYHKDVSPEEADIWIYEMDRKLSTRFTFGPGRNDDPRWSPDGQTILFTSDRDGVQSLYVKPFDGSEARRLPQSDSPFKNTMGWSPDGKWVLYTQVGPQTAMDIWMAPADGNGEATPFLATRFAESTVDVSPDGKWAVFQSTESGAAEVYIASFPNPGRRYRVSSGGAFGGTWSADGNYVWFFDATAKAYRSRVTTEPEIRAGRPEYMFTHDPSIRGGSFADHADLSVLVHINTQEAAQTITAVSGWQSLLEQR